MPDALRGVSIEYAELTDPGRDPAKQVNEDAVGYAATPLGHLLVVCDGMGGHMGGRLASHTAVGRVVSHMMATREGAHAPEELRHAVEAAGHGVYEVGGDAPIEMRPGSTNVTALLDGANLQIAHVGDSRLYLVRAGQIYRMTRDHSMVQQMVESGMITEEQAIGHPDANRITRALGMMDQVDVEVAPSPTPLGVGDILLLCSDGLSDMVRDHEILAILLDAVPAGVAVACQRLVDVANDRGGYDNITVQVVRVSELPSGPSATVVDTTTAAPAPTAPGAPAAVRDGVVPTEPGPDPQEANDRVLVDEPLPLSSAYPRPAPTLVDDAGQGPYPRVTEPGVTASEAAGYGPSAHPQGAVGAPSPHEAAREGSPRSRDLRWWLAGTVALCALVLLATLAWWIFGTRAPKASTDAMAPPIAPRAVLHEIPVSVAPSPMADAVEPTRPATTSPGPVAPTTAAPSLVQGRPRMLAQPLALPSPEASADSPSPSKQAP